MDLEVYWSGSLEAQGKAPGLSSYQGRSSIYHSANWERLDMLEHGEAKARSVNGHPKRSEDGQWRRKACDPETAAEALRLLKSGISYNQISVRLNVSVSVPRRLGRLHGIDRRHMQGQNNRRDRTNAKAGA
jgi:hypothetical protein